MAQFILNTDDVSYLEHLKAFSDSLDDRGRERLEQFLSGMKAGWEMANKTDPKAV